MIAGAGTTKSLQKVIREYTTWEADITWYNIIYDTPQQQKKRKHQVLKTSLLHLPYIMQIRRSHLLKTPKPQFKQRNSENKY